MLLFSAAIRPAIEQGYHLSLCPNFRGRLYEHSAKHAQPGLLKIVDADRKTGKGITGYEYAVLVTNTDDEVLCLGQLYRDRADAENAFDELKNQWGWGGFTTRDLQRCQLAARGVALIYDRRKSLWDNWWSLFVRLASPDTRREAITSRPWLMSSVGRRTEHAGQTTITLTGLHAHFEKARAMLMRLSALLQAWVTQAAEQLTLTPSGIASAIISSAF